MPATRDRPRAVRDRRSRRVAFLLGAAAAALLLAAAGACRTASPARQAEADPDRGRQLLRDYGCAGCHSIPGVAGASGQVGPPLWAMGDRGYVAGVLPNSDANLRRWIQEPRQVNPLTAMPDVGVTDEDAAHIAAYLSTLRAEPVAVRLTRGFVERAMGRRAADIALPERTGGD